MTITNTGRLIIDFEGPRLDQSDIELLCRPEVGGAILFARNFQSRRQIRELVGEIRAVKADALICVDQEGGRVQRFTDGFTRLPALQNIRRLAEAEPNNSEQILSSLAWLMAVEVMSTGVDLSFAPVLDLDETRSMVIGDRSLSSDPDQATQLGRIYLQAMHDAGMATTAKHFPGHGGVVGDSHIEQPVDNRSFEELKQRDLIPFSELIPLLDAVMPAHVIYPQVDSKPAGFSRKWIQQILRKDLGFSGVVFSDDLSMEGAASAGNGIDRAGAAIEAGCDLLLVCNDRTMAKQVLQWMIDDGVPGSGAAVSMAARTSWTESEIMEHENFALAQQFIKKIEEGSSRV